MRPEGIGRRGSLIASTWRSNQSLMAWLLPQTNGPASTMPATRKPQRSDNGTPEDTTPHMNAHIGGNQVTGFNSSRTSRGRGTRRIGSGIVTASIGVS
jgi:hypothetical protein